MNGVSDTGAATQQRAKTPQAGQPTAVGLGRYGYLVQRWRTRRALLALSDQHLRDIGLSREQAIAEGSKPFWKA
ncbi:DUF1127 domain-containing protein [Pseudomonas cremoricolorata]|uniref:DUF1127 domain-containing protein n=1 Tax=Pseudomonas cremoricolorata TaxID=157783 RepID=UPI0004144787|nr:DUF1127 domain-containing protein [Pseudomonas cremoricolorata]